MSRKARSSQRDARKRKTRSAQRALASVPKDALLALPPPAAAAGELMPYDPHLPERARTQWQFGDWESLARIDAQALQHHPQRAQLNLFAAAGHLQQGTSDDRTRARHCLQNALDAGADRIAVARTLIASVHRHLARAAALAGQPQTRVLDHFEQALRVGSPGADASLLLGPSVARQLQDLGQRAQSERLLDLAKGMALAAPSQGAILPPAAASPPEVAAQAGKPLFNCQVDIDGQQRRVNFTPASPEPYSVQNGILSFQLPPGKPGYLVSNESGDFNVAPDVNQLPLAPDTAYEISGHIACEDCREPPIIWVFEYADGKKINGHSFMVRNGKFKKHFQTQSTATAYSLGIRVTNKGSFDFLSSCFKIGAHSSSQEELERQFWKTVFAPKDLTAHPIFLLPIDSRLEDSQGFLVIDASGKVLSCLKTDEFFDYRRKGFRGACFVEKKIYVCNSFSLKIYEYGPALECQFNLLDQIARPEWLIGRQGNADLHHVFFDNNENTILVANSYMDSVDQLSIDGRFIGRKFLWEISPAIKDLVKDRNPKAPDLCHINHIARVDNDILLTLGNLNGTRIGCVISYVSGEIILDKLAFPHDGVFFNNEYAITESDENRILYYKNIQKASDLRLPKEPIILELNQDYLFGENLFWSRGIFINEEFIYVGCSQFQDRNSRAEGVFPSHIIVIDKKKLKVIGRIPIPEIEGLKKPVIYSLIDFKSSLS